jgi:carbonic anhydrase/acetyltransferase-like protein (isoleucine patch superfamily)
MVDIATSERTADDHDTTTTPTTETYINTTMTQNYIASSVHIANPKLCEIKGRSIIHSNVQIQNGTNHNNKNSGIPIRIGRYCHIQSNTILQQNNNSTGSSDASSSFASSLPTRYYGIDDVDGNPNTHHDAATTSDDAANRSVNDPTDAVTTTTMASPTMITTIGSHTMIGQHCNICIDRPVSIGNQVQIGDHVTIGHSVMIKDNCIIASNTIVPPHTVIPPFTYCYSQHRSNTRDTTTTTTTTNESELSQSPRQQRRHWHLRMDVAGLPPGTTMVLQEQAMTQYNQFVRQQKSAGIES